MDYEEAKDVVVNARGAKMKDVPPHLLVMAVRGTAKGAYAAIQRVREAARVVLQHDYSDYVPDERYIPPGK